MKSIVLAVVIGLAGTSPNAAQDKVVVYVRASEPGYELRVVRPSAADELLARLAGRPENVFWNEGFETLYFRVDATVYRMPWVHRAESEAILPEAILPEAILPEAILNDTPDADELWIDAETGSWRAYEIGFPEAGAEMKYRARIYEHRGAEGWSLLIERETQGCEAGDGSMCGAEVQIYRQGRRGVFLADAQQDMRIATHLDRLGMEFDRDMEDEPQFLPSGLDENVGIELDIRLGDTLHGFGPVRWVDRRAGSTREIFAERPSGCGRQVGFEEYSVWLLLTAEYGGRCARVVSLADGEIVWRAPEGSSLAAWVKAPRSE